MDNVNQSGYVYMPYLNVAFNPPYPQSAGNVGPYQQNTAQVVQGQTGMVKTQSNKTIGAVVGPPSFSTRGRGSFDRGGGRGRRPQRPFVPHDICARCGEKGQDVGPATTAVNR